MSVDFHRAVFLSYASQDAETARRICETLRAGGVEVWFDVEGGLEHGDEWDAKIRRQIKECVLFIPIISAHTQARHEGYFRLEWELAAQRAMSIASGVPFILPVVIDDTREPDALVPDRFRTVQWTKLRGGEVPADVQQRFLKLWSHRTGVLKHVGDRGAQTSSSASNNSAGGAPELLAKRRWLVPAIVAATAVTGLAFWFFASRAPSVSSSKPTTVAAPASTEADQLVRQARELIYDPDSARNEFALAENLLKRSTDLTPTSGAAWGASALLNHYFYSRTYDTNRQRLVRSQAEAEKSLRLDPRNTDALLAFGLHRQVLGENDRARDYLERAHASDPQNPKVILAQSRKLSDHSARAQFLLEAAGRVPRPAELFYYASIELRWARRLEPARVACERAIAAQPFWRTFVARADVEYLQSADPVKIDTWLDRVPELKRDEPRVAVARYLAAMLRRDTATAIRVLTVLAVDFLEDSYFVGPKAFLLAQALELGGQPKQALEQWQLAERTVREKISADPGEIGWRAMLAVILAGEHRTADAKALADACAADERLKHAALYAIETTAQAYVVMGEPSRALALLRAVRQDKFDGNLSAATLAAEPRWAPLHDLPGYPELVKELKQSEGIAANDAPAVGAAPDPKSVAVLPFTNQSDDKGNEYFSEGISEELSNTLTKIPGLRVIGRTSAFSFKGKNTPLPEIARQLGVTYLIDGSVRKSGAQVRIAAQLVNAATGTSLWSEIYSRELKDVFATQSEIAQAIVGELRGKLTGDAGTTTKAEIQAQVQAAQRGGTKSTAAHELYLQGKFFAAQSSLASLAKAADCFQRAVTVDSSFALGWAALSRVTALRTLYIDTTLKELAATFERARQAADRALTLEPDLAEGYFARAEIQFSFDLDWRGARESLRRALALAPNDADVLCIASRVARATGELEQSLELGRRATQLDPVSAEFRYFLAQTYESLGRFAEAEVELRRAFELNPTTLAVHRRLSFVLLLQGKPADALDEAGRETIEWSRLTAQALAHWALKDRSRSDAALARLVEIASDTCAYQIAQIHAYRGEGNQAFVSLDRAYAYRDSGLSGLRSDPFLVNLRSDPRWPDLLRKIGLHDEQLR